MIKNTKKNEHSESQFIPHKIAIKRVKDSFERSKKKQKEGLSEFIEVK